MKTVLLLFIIYCATTLAVPEWDNIENENKETIKDDANKADNSAYGQEQNGILSLSESVKYQGDISVKIGRKWVCLYIKGKRYGCASGSHVCGAKIGMFSLGCRDDEDKIGLHCIKKCSLLAGPAFPLRKSAYTCTRRGCNKNEISSLGVCYEKCKEHYTMSVPRCFGHCDHFCGSEYKNAGLFCRHKKIYKKTCRKPIYRQKSFKEYEPKTNKGKKMCSGYYVDGKGGCPKMDISAALPSIHC